MIENFFAPLIEKKKTIIGICLELFSQQEMSFKRLISKLFRKREEI